MRKELKEIQNQIIDASIALLNDMKDSDSQYIAFSIYTDEGAMTICPAANTQEHLNECLANDSDEDPDYYQTTPAEWAFESDDLDTNGHFDAVNDQLCELTESIIESDFEAYANEFYNCCFHALKNIKKQHILSNCQFYFAISDSDFELTERWNKELNS